MSSLMVHSERSARTGICIVWPAWFAGSTDAHLHATALFLGNTDTVEYTREDVQEALQHYLWPGQTKVVGFDWFGYNKDIPVLKLEHTNLLAISRQDIKTRLEQRGIHADTQYAFNPHVTIAKEAPERPEIWNSYYPLEIHLESPVLWWGDDRKVHSNHAERKAAA